MNQERKEIKIITRDGTLGKQQKPHTGNWRAWTPQQRADAMQRECAHFDHLKRYGKYGS